MSGRQSQTRQKTALVQQFGSQRNLVEKNLDDGLELTWIRKVWRPAGDARKGNEDASKRKERNQRLGRPLSPFNCAKSFSEELTVERLTQAIKG